MTQQRAKKKEKERKRKKKKERKNKQCKPLHSTQNSQVKILNQKRCVIIL